MGNPQNLYLFSYNKLHAWQFFTAVGVFTTLGLLWLLLLNQKNTNEKLQFTLDAVELKDKKLAILWGVVFVIIVLSVFGIVNIAFAFLLTVVVAFCINRGLLLKADYPLLITFICFFIFIGNISHIPAKNTLLKGGIGQQYIDLFRLDTAKPGHQQCTQRHIAVRVHASLEGTAGWSKRRRYGHNYCLAGQCHFIQAVHK